MLGTSFQTIKLMDAYSLCKERPTKLNSLKPSQDELQDCWSRARTRRHWITIYVSVLEIGFHFIFSTTQLKEGFKDSSKQDDNDQISKQFIKHTLVLLDTTKRFLGLLHLQVILEGWFQLKNPTLRGHPTLSYLRLFWGYFAWLGWDWSSKKTSGDASVAVIEI